MKVIVDLDELSDETAFYVEQVCIPFNDNAISILEGATNGDMLTALFGEKALITLDTHNYLNKWWNAPYKGAIE